MQKVALIFFQLIIHFSMLYGVVLIHVLQWVSFGYIYIRLGDVYICWVLVGHNQFAVHINSKPKESYKLTMIILFLNKDYKKYTRF